MEVRVPSLLALFFFFSFFLLLAVSLPLFLSAQCIRTQRFVACFCSRSPACRFSPVCTGVRAEREFLSVPFIYICIYVCTKESSIQGNRGARNSTWSNGSVEREKTVYFCLSFFLTVASSRITYRAKSFSRVSARGRARMFVAHFTKTVRSAAIRRWVVQWGIKF